MGERVFGQQFQVCETFTAYFTQNKSVHFQLMIPTSILPVEDTFIGALSTNILLLKVHGFHVATESFLRSEPFIANTAYQTQVAVFILVNEQ